MKKQLHKIIAILIAVVLIFSTTIPAFANYVTASLIDNSISNSKWMSAISDDTKLSDISIPGTHDSGTKWINTPIAGAWTTTQDLTIPQQLEAGVRYLDIRLAYDSSKDGETKIMHSSIECLNEYNSTMTFKDVYRYLKNFLTANPNETVIISIKEDAGNAAQTLAEKIQQQINQDPNFWYTGTATPTLGSVRGKVVVATRISQFNGGIRMNWGDQGNDGSAVDYGWYKIQDRYSMGADAKWNNAVKPMLDEKKPNSIWYLSFLSTTGGGISGVAANSGTMNSYYSRYEAQNNKCYGIIVFDYVSENLAKKVYKCNDLVTKKQPNTDTGQYYYRINLNTYSNVADGWSYVALRLYYKDKNGTGTEKSKLIFDNTNEYNGYQFVCNLGNFDFSGMIDGFPTKLEFSYDWGYGAKTLGQQLNMYVAKSPNDNLVKCAENNFYGSSSTSTPYKGTEYYFVKSSQAPIATSVKFESPNKEIVPVPQQNSTDIIDKTYVANVYDQYGVKWNKGVTSYTLNNVYDGVEQNGNQIRISNIANDNPPNTTMILKAEYNDGSNIIQANKEIQLLTNPIYYKFINNDGTILQDGQAYAGTTPTYSGTLPTATPSQQYHYTFRGWDNTNPLSLNNNVYVAKYTTAQHTISQVEHINQSTCISGGTNRYTCECGYSWEVSTSPIGHSLITEDKEPTCVDDGYHIIRCTRCDYVQTNERKNALGHNVNGAILGEHVAKTNTSNGYQTYICPIDNVEIIELRQYDVNDWSGYQSGLKAVEDIKSDSSYSTYNDTAKTTFESKIQKAKEIENKEYSKILQFEIDIATQTIIEAIDEFSSEVGTKFYNITFIKADGTVISTRYKEGTLANEISKPTNSGYDITETRHTVYKWGAIKNVTNDATYREYGVTSEHSYNTFIYPTINIEPTCTNIGTTTYECLCGYTYTEYFDELGHDYNQYINNGDGTHSKNCSRNPEHTELELCDLTNDYNCNKCGYSIDLSVYESLILLAQESLNNKDEFTQVSINQLESIYNDSVNSISNVRTQAEVDYIIENLQTAYNNLVSRLCDTSFYVYSNGKLTKINQSGYRGENIMLTVPDVYKNVYKWTATNTITNVTTRISTDSSINVIAGEDTENTQYIAFIDENRNSSVSSISLTGKNGKITDTIFVENGEYEVTVSNDCVIIDNKALKAQNCPFYNVVGFDINQTINVQNNVIINTYYEAK